MKTVVIMEPEAAALAMLCFIGVCIIFGLVALWLWLAARWIERRK